MRLMMVGPSLHPAVRHMLDWALDAGHQVCLVDIEKVYEPPAASTIQFVRSAVGYGIIMDERRLSPEARETWHRHVRSGAQQFRQVAEHFQPDVIHVHGLHLPAACCAQAGLRPLVISVLCALDSTLQGHVTLDQGGPLQHLFDGAARVIALNPATVEACKRLPRPPRTALIPVGTDTRHFRPGQAAQRAAWRRALRIPREVTVLLSPRGWHRVHNQEQILEAYALARPRCRRPTVLAFIGLVRASLDGHKQQVAWVQRRAQDLGFADDLRWLPQLRYELMPGFFALGDVVLNYPSEDGFPLTLVEAAACEVPIVTARLPAYQDTFVEEYCTLVEPGRPAALAEGIVATVNQHPEERAERLRAARQVIVEQYDDRVVRQRMLRLYEEVAGVHA